MKTKKISVTFLIALMFIATFFVISFSPTVSASTSSLQNIDDVCAQMTQSETNGGINLKDYVEDFAERIQYQREIPMAAFAFQYDAEIESSLFANNTTYSLYNDSNVCATVEMIITGDNNITKFIPRQLFTQPCEKLYIGSEYGFYISTVEADGITKSTVVLFDTTKVVLDNYAFDFKIEVLARMNFVYLTSAISQISTDSTVEPSYIDHCDVSFNNTTDAVVAKIHQREMEKGASVYNYQIGYREADVDVKDTINIYAVTENPTAGGVVGYLKNATMTYSTVCDVDVNFVSDGGIEHYIIAPQMGKIVGYMDNSHINYACMVRTILDYGSLPERDRKNIFNSWHYPRQYIGAYGNGACGNKTSNSTISNENWIHPALQTSTLRNVSTKQRIAQLKLQNAAVFNAMQAQRVVN